MTPQEIAQSARQLFEAEKTGKQCGLISLANPQMDLDDAYAVQAALVAAKRQAGIDRGDEVIVGVNKYRLGKEDPLDIRDIDNTAVLASQVRRLKRVRDGRDQTACDAALAALETGAREGTGNLLALAVEAARARCG